MPAAGVWTTPTQGVVIGFCVGAVKVIVHVQLPFFVQCVLSKFTASGVVSTKVHAMGI